MKKIFAAVLAALMIVSLLPVTALAASEPITYTFADYAAGTQYAVDEEHVLDDKVTVVTTQAHFTSELRLYSSTSHNGFAIIKASNITAFGCNAGNKVDTLNVFGSNDEGTTWENAGSISVTATSYKDYSLELPQAYDWLKIDVAGANQIRIKSMTLTMDASEPEVSDCEHEWDEGVVTTPSTCKTQGVMTYTCTKDATHTKTEKLPLGEHSYVDDVCEVCGDVIEPTADSTLTIAEALALGAKYTKDSYTTGKFYVSGEITEVYNTTYGNMYIKDEEGNTLTVYGTYSADGSTRYDAMETKPIAGDKVTVYGVIGKYNDPQMKEAWITAHEQTGCKHETTEAIGEAKESTCTETGITAGVKCTVCGAVVEAQTEIPKAAHDYVEGKCSVCGAEEPNVVEATLTFDDTAKRTAFSDESQVWEENGIIVTNNKDASTNKVANYSNPVRLYKNSTLIISYPQMSKIKFVWSGSADYSIEASLKDKDLGTVSQVADGVLLELAAVSDEISIVLSGSQVRLDAIVVTAEKANAEHQHTEETVPGYAATCTEPGLTDGVKCAECGEILTAQETIDALGHKWGERVFDAEKKAFVTDCANCDEQIVEEATEGAIVTSPASVNVLVRDTVEFKVETTGDIASYKWQYSKDNGKSWYTSTLSTTDTVSMTAYTDVNGRQMRCIVVDVFGNELVSDAATINIDVLKITENPKDVECYNRQTVTMSVEVSYSGTYTYQWQYSQNGTTWYNSSLEGNKTETLRFTAYSDIDGRQFRCAIKDQKGGLTYSQPGKLTVKKMDYEKVATVNAKAYEATSITIQVTSGEDVKIQWQYSQNGTTWYNSTLEGNKTETLRFTAYKDINERQFRCVLVDAYGNRVVTDATVLYVE